LGSAGDATSMAIASMLDSNQNSAFNRYVQLLSQPKQPGFLQSLATGAVGSLNFSPIKI
jgi:hypothetical protein